MTPRERLRRRIGAYKDLANGVLLLDSDFRGVFASMMRKHNIPYESKDRYSQLINVCSDDEIIELNMALDCYQIDKKMDKRN